MWFLDYVCELSRQRWCVGIVSAPNGVCTRLQVVISQAAVSKCLKRYGQLVKHIVLSSLAVWGIVYVLG